MHTVLPLPICLVGKEVSLSQVTDELRRQIAESGSDSHVFMANWVAINGTTYKKNCGLLRTEDDIPLFIKLLNVYVCDHKVYFHVKNLDTLEFSTHFHCFVHCFVVKLGQIEISYSDLLLYVPHHLRSFPGHPERHCIVPCYHFLLS